MTYRQFMASRDWIALHNEAVAKAGFACESCCSSERLTAHHVFYPDPIEFTTLKHLMVLCWSCHQLVHRSWAVRPFCEDASDVRAHRDATLEMLAERRAVDACLRVESERRLARIKRSVVRAGCQWKDLP